MRHDITEDVLRLIRQAIDDNRGSKANFCRDSGIRPYELSKILSGEKKVVLDDIWWKICNYFPELDDRQTKIKNHNAVNIESTKNSACALSHCPAEPPVDRFLQVVLEVWEKLPTEERAQVAGLAAALSERAEKKIG